VSKHENEDSKLKFKVALEKKNKISKEPSKDSDPNERRKVRESSGKTPKMFRRKSG